MGFSLRPPKKDVGPPVSIPGGPRPSFVPPPTSIVGGQSPEIPEYSPTADVPDGGFTSPNVVKGRLTNVRTRYALEFMFNPTEIQRTDAWQWGHHGIPGASHPVISGGSGGSRTISFTLYLDADRGRADARRDGGSGDTSLDLTTVLNALRQWTYPVPQGTPNDSSLMARGPDRVMFSMGPMFTSLECVVVSVGIHVTQWTPKMEPMRATVDVQLEEFMNHSVQATDIFQEPANGSVAGDFNNTGDGSSGLG